MKFQDIWNQLLRKRPALADSEKVVEFRPAALKMLLEQVYEQGVKAGSPPPAPNFGDIFGDLRSKRS